MIYRFPALLSFFFFLSSPITKAHHEGATQQLPVDSGGSMTAFWIVIGVSVVVIAIYLFFSLRSPRS